MLQKPGDFEALKGSLWPGAARLIMLLWQSSWSERRRSARGGHRLRKRFREIYRQEIHQTLAEGADLEAELRHLAPPSPGLNAIVSV